MVTPHPLAHVLEAAAKDENARFQSKVLGSHDWSVNMYTLQEVLNSPLHHTWQWRVYEAPPPEVVVRHYQLLNDALVTATGGLGWQLRLTTQGDKILKVDLNEE